MTERIQPFTVRQKMLKNNYEIYYYRDSYLKDVMLHHHDFYEIYLFLNGSVDYIVESRNYHLQPGDILLINPFELHQPRFTQPGVSYERIVLWLNRSFVEQFSTPQTSLTRCFDSSVAGHTNLLRLPLATRQHITELMTTLVNESGNGDYGGDLLAISHLIQLLVALNCAAEHLAGHHELADKSSPIISNVLSYINEHYHEKLTLDQIAAQFFMNKYHLSHEFNRLVGTSIYRYIIQRRLIIAKQMLLDHVPPTVVYHYCGFADYSNFYRAFKAEYGISPKAFVAMSQED